MKKQAWHGPTTIELTMPHTPSQEETGKPPEEVLKKRAELYMATVKLNALNPSPPSSQEQKLAHRSIIKGIDSSPPVIQQLGPNQFTARITLYLELDSIVTTESITFQASDQNRLRTFLTRFISTVKSYLGRLTPDQAVRATLHKTTDSYPQDLRHRIRSELRGVQISELLSAEPSRDQLAGRALRPPSSALPGGISA
jgi:hypothetical protein